MAEETEASRALRMRIQVEWENAMDYFYGRLDRLSEFTKITDAEMVEAVKNQIDEDTADDYKNWINGA
jgi:hypothetical protein